MSVSFPGESEEYRTARERLLELEVEQRRQMEAVAEARRSLPPGGTVAEDYVFEEVVPGERPREVRLSELFEPGRGSLAIYSFMFPRGAGDERPGPTEGATAELPLGESPCPSCVAMIDQLDAAAFHATAQLNLAVVAKTSAERLGAYVAERGWRNLRFLSSANNTYNRDYRGETEDGGQMPVMNVFERDGDAIRHFWATELMFAPADPGQHPRHMGTLEPVWNLFDLTREGRPDWDEQLRYD